MTEPQGQNSDGTLKPPTAHESDIPLEKLSQPQNSQPQQMETRILTMDEADLLRAERAFVINRPFSLDELKNIDEIKYHAYMFSKLLIEICPAGKERSQALGSISQARLWAIASIEEQAR